MKQYDDCIRKDGFCVICTLSKDNGQKDCHGENVNRLFYLRSKANMTQTELSKKSGVHVSTIRTYEKNDNNYSNMQVDTAIALCHALKYDLNDFFEEILNP